jgi:protein TonB
MRPSPSLRIVHASSRLLAVVTLAAIAAACSSGEADVGGSGFAEPAPAAAAEAAPSTAIETLEAKAQQAVADNRIFAPEGENAIEFYLAQRERGAQGGASADAALVELQPYAMMAAEQAIAGEDFAEAERLIALMVRIDPTAPSLARLREDLDAARDASAAALAAAEAQVEAEAAAEAQAAATPPPPPSRAPATAVRTPSPAPARPANPATTAAAPTQRPAATPATPARSAPAAAPGPLVPVSTPFPPFPSEAIARGRSNGSVTARFTIQADGRVADVRIVEARPEGLFERTVIETLGEWRFEPTNGDRTETRTFSFRN